MRLVRPPLVRMDVTMSSLSSKALSCSSVVKCSLFPGSNRESTVEITRDTNTKKRMSHEGCVHQDMASSNSQLTIVPRAVVETMFVQCVWQVHPSAGVQANALKLPVGVAENGPAHLAKL